MVTRRDESQGDDAVAGDALPGLRTVAGAGCPFRLVQAVVAEVFDVPLNAMRARSRGEARVALARQVAMYLCHVALGADHGRVAAAFGRDRTTATHACARVEDRRDQPDFDRVVGSLEALFTGLPPQRVDGHRGTGPIDAGACSCREGAL